MEGQTDAHLVIVREALGVNLERVKELARFRRLDEVVVDRLHRVVVHLKWK
jgi:hypothetical protein